MTDEDDKLDLSAWDADEPPEGFAERVLLAAREAEEREIEAPAEPLPGPERKPETPVDRPAEVRAITSATPKGRRRGLVVALFAAVSAAAAWMILSNGAPSHGEVVAEGVRKEVMLGNRAVAVLEPGASLSWQGNRVEQAKGNVFYRVEKGDGFRVHTAAGDVEVQGTCFRVDLEAKKSSEAMQARDWKVGAVGAIAAASMMVAVYEGKVAVSHAQERVMLKAGDSAIASDAQGVQLTSADGTSASGSESSESALENANRNLVGTVSDVKRRLETIESQKKELEAKLAAAEQKLAAENRANDAAPTKNDFDLSQDDLVSLAKEGTLKYRYPCSKSSYRPDAEAIQKLGLAPQDGETISEAYRKVAQWREANMRSVCQEVVGKSDLSERMPVDSCLHLVSDFLAETDPKARREAQQLAVDIRAGLKPMPGPNEKLPALTRLMLASVQQLKVFEDELGKNFGPAEAHRITYSDALCMGNSTWGGGKK
jgi:ferric-dicitrate binding protein FerR (iron transport regulator)